MTFYRILPQVHTCSSHFIMIYPVLSHVFTFFCHMLSGGLVTFQTFGELHHKGPKSRSPVFADSRASLKGLPLQ